jgi:hypothetical protein
MSDQIFEIRDKDFATTKVIVGLFSILFVLQLADLHSTVTAAANQVEQSQLILSLCRFLSFKVAVLLIKIFDMAVVVGLFACWRKSRGAYDREFAVCVTVALVAYLPVVFTNYNT